MSEKLTRKEHHDNNNNCPKCGKKIAPDAVFCPNCGEKLDGKNPKQSDKFSQYKPNKKRLTLFKEFLKNNFELSHTVYGVIFLITLFSKSLGLILLIVAAIILYMMALTNSGKAISANQNLIKFYTKMANKSKDVVSEAQKKAEKPDTIHSDDLQSKQDTAMTSDNNEKRPVKKGKSTYKYNYQFVKANNFGPSAILLIVSALMALYGVLGSGFITMTNASLSSFIDQYRAYAKALENVGQIFGGSSGGNADMIQLAGYSLIIIPIIVIAFSCVTSSKLMKLVSFIASIIELGLFIFVISYIADKASQLLGSYSGSVFQTILDPSNGIFGMPAISFVIGVVLMVILSGYRLFKPKYRRF